jgi:hypothetical protein
LGNGTYRTYGGTIIDSQGYPVVTPDEAYKIYTQARQGATKDAQALLSFTGPGNAATQASMNTANALQAKAGADALAKIGYSVDANGEMVKGTRPTATTPVTTAATPVTTATTATAPVTTATTPAATATTPVTTATTATTPVTAAATAATATQAGPSIASLYQSYLGRAPEAGGAEYWNNKFGPTIDAAEEAEFTLSSKAITGEFVSDVAKATLKYSDKAISISGKVTAVSDSIVTIDQTIICNFQSPKNSIKNGQLISVKGRLVGFDDLMGELKLDQCSINKNN